LSDFGKAKFPVYFVEGKEGGREKEEKEEKEEEEVREGKEKEEEKEKEKEKEKENEEEEGRGGKGDWKKREKGEKEGTKGEEGEGGETTEDWSEEWMESKNEGNSIREREEEKGRRKGETEASDARQAVNEKKKEEVIEEEKEGKVEMIKGEEGEDAEEEGREEGEGREDSSSSEDIVIVKEVEGRLSWARRKDEGQGRAGIEEEPELLLLGVAHPKFPTSDFLAPLSRSNSENIPEASEILSEISSENPKPIRKQKSTTTIDNLRSMNFYGKSESIFRSRRQLDKYERALDLAGNFSGLLEQIPATFETVYFFPFSAFFSFTFSHVTFFRKPKLRRLFGKCFTSWKKKKIPVPGITCSEITAQIIPRTPKFRIRSGRGTIPREGWKRKRGKKRKTRKRRRKERKEGQREKRREQARKGKRTNRRRRDRRQERRRGGQGGRKKGASGSCGPTLEGGS
jgi:hypothetical protein